MDSSYEIIDSTGKLRRKLLKDSLIKLCYEGCIIDGIDYKNDIIVTKNDNKFGIEKLSSDKKIIDYTYDSINLINNVGMYNSSNYFIGKIGNNYNLYSITNGDAITKNGYEIIEMLDDNTLLVYNNKAFSIIDLNENKITDKIIKVNGLVEFPPKMTYGYNIYTADNIVTISISDGTSIEDRKVVTYTYDLSTKELKEKLTNN